jgi:hypothetical protein
VFLTFNYIPTTARKAQPAVSAWSHELKIFSFPRSLASNKSDKEKVTQEACEADSKKGDSFLETDSQLP